jgi:CSLREA domain-containing protein
MSGNNLFLKSVLRGCAVVVIVGLLVLLFTPVISLAGEKYEFVTKWGSYGSGDGQLYYPQTIAVDTNGNVYVADNYYRIQKFTTDGEFITKWSLITLDEDSDGVEEYWYLNYSHVALAVDVSRNVYTIATFMGDDYEVKTDYGDYYQYQDERLLKIAADGSVAILRRPDGFVDIAVGPDGSVYLAIVRYLYSSSGEYSIQKFTSDDTYVTEWSVEDVIGDIEVDTEGSVYVGTSGSIKKYTTDGEFITEWGVYSDDIFVDKSYVNCLGVDASGNVYIGAYLKPYDEEYQLSIQKFTSDGKFITQFGSLGTGDGQFDYAPTDVAIDTKGIVYVLETTSHRVQKFALKEAEDETALIVNTTGDKSDANPNDGVADVDLNEEGNQCTLRAAIEEANRRSDEDSTITFDIPTDDSGYNSSTGIVTISPKKPLPTVKKSVTIDATTQSDGTIELNGENAGENADGLRITAGDCSIKGLVIKGFKGNGITVKDEGEINLSDVEIVENCGWGIRATGNINIGVENGITVSQESKIGNNGNKSNCKGGGIRSSNGGVSASYLEVTDNGGAGILATEDIDLYGAQVNNNRGPGIQSFEGIITFNAISDFSNQVIGNKGYGIFSGRAQDPDDPKPYGVKIGTSIEVKDNALYEQQWQRHGVLGRGNKKPGIDTFQTV